MGLGNKKEKEKNLFLENVKGVSLGIGISLGYVALALGTVLLLLYLITKFYEIIPKA
ncbi:MAG: hypothetical protein ACTSX6_09345 [Candidatus Heimdallarchaeaceae archaeon]